MANLTLNDLKQICIEDQIPIIQEEALSFILDLIEKEKIESILEIGTAYGYSAICFSLKNTQVTTIEKDVFRAKMANSFIKDMKANVKLIVDDALNVNNLVGPYDLIFIDAAKSKYINYFEKFSKLLSPKGIIITDNMYFHNLTIENTNNRGTKSLLKKLENYKDYLLTHKDFETQILNLGDGLAISKRK